jgi:hypothetical protein
MTDVAGEDVKSSKDEDEYTRSHRSRFKFKSKKRSPDDRRSSPEGSDRRKHRHEHRHHHSKRRKRSPVGDSPHLYDDTYLPNTSSTQYMDPDTAFRESLLDAMADDEGAQFWEGVYGQPIHTYSDVKQGPQGELEKMTDEEYAAYVRAKMYEKTHQHLLEEKARRDAAKKEQERLAKEGRREEREAQRFRDKVEESLKRGEERKKKRVWEERWATYMQRWEELGKPPHRIPWPTESGSRKDITRAEVEKFFLLAPSSGSPNETELFKILKSERVRWHPDKIQQKLGGQGVDESTIRAVTEVFQIIDAMWNEGRNR